MEIGIALREARVAAGLGQRELAELMQISQGFLSDLEKGNRTFHRRYLDRLPDRMRDPVRDALVELHEAQIKLLMKE